MKRSTARLAQGIALIAVGMVAIVIAALVWVSEQHHDAHLASKEPFIALLGVLAMVGGIARLAGKIGS